MMDAGGRDEAPHPAFVAGEAGEQLEHARVVAALLTGQREAQVTSDVPVADRNRACVAERDVAHQADRPYPDARQRA